MSVDFDTMVRHLMSCGATREAAEARASATLRREAVASHLAFTREAERPVVVALAQTGGKCLRCGGFFVSVYDLDMHACPAARPEPDTKPRSLPSTPRRRSVQREHLSQADVFRRAREYAALHPEHAVDLDAMYANPNKAKRTEREWGEMMAEGFKKGTPDFVCPWPRVWQGRVVGALYVEMKEPKNGPSEDQLRRRDALRAAGNRVEIAWSADEAWGYVLDHLHCQTP